MRCKAQRAAARTLYSTDCCSTRSRREHNAVSCRSSRALLQHEIATQSWTGIQQSSRPQTMVVCTSLVLLGTSFVQCRTLLYTASTVSEATLHMRATTLFQYLYDHFPIGTYWKMDVHFPIGVVLVHIGKWSSLKQWKQCTAVYSSAQLLAPIQSLNGAAQCSGCSSRGCAYGFYDGTWRQRHHGVTAFVAAEHRRAVATSTIATSR